jgi:N-acetylmuramoyl-L-alanine amidase
MHCLSSGILLLSAMLASACGPDVPQGSKSSGSAAADMPQDRPRSVTTISHARTAPVDSPVIAIDPGHPSETSAGANQNGVAEVRVAWQVALKLRDELRLRGYRVVLTKEREDQLVRNADRARIANEAGAQLMVRLHCDAASGSGFAVYYPDRKGTVQGMTGPSDSIITRSRQAAEAVHEGMALTLAGHLKDGGIRGDSRTLVGGRQGALTGSIFSRVPILTVEMVVLTHRPDAEFIAREEGQRLMTRALAAGVQRFVPVLPSVDSIAPSSTSPGEPDI